MYNYFLFLTLVICAPALLFAQGDFVQVLPQPPQCGNVREQQFFNLKGTVEPDELTWMAALRFKNNTRLQCMGVLIHQKYVLTKASCFNEGSGRRIDAIELGSCSKEANDCVVVRKFDVIKHPIYDAKNKDVTTQLYNIVLLRLEDPVKFTRYISPICLPTPADKDTDYVGQHLTVTGLWTKGNNDRKFFALVQSLSHCISDYQNVNENFICANICDNGKTYALGSALLGLKLRNSQLDHYYLVGLDAISDSKYCEKLSADIFLRVDHLVGWITETIIESEIF